MTLRRKLGLTTIAVAVTGVACWFLFEDFRSFVYLGLRAAHFAVHPAPAYCKKRAEDFQAEVKLMERDAKNSLKVGASNDAVVRFFASKNIPLTFDREGQEKEARGTLNFKGLSECENIACGDDSSLIGVRVKVNVDGTVASDPVVIGMYTDCL